MTALKAAISAAGADGPPQWKPDGPGVAGGPVEDVDAATLGLLWRLRVALAATATPVVQFAPCAREGATGAVALGFARAAAAMWGRTLLINARESGGRERQGDMACVLPDAFVPRLYHQGVSGAPLFAMLSRPMAPASPGSGMFDVVIIDQASPLSCDAACITAQLCTGTVLVVQAGVSDLASISMAVGRIVSMGGAVFGTVLAEVPAWALRH